MTGRAGAERAARELCRAMFTNALDKDVEMVATAFLAYGKAQRQAIANELEEKLNSGGASLGGAVSGIGWAIGYLRTTEQSESDKS